MTKNYRKLCLALDPGCKLMGPKPFGHYRIYWVVDSKGREIGYTDGNERGASWAWLRAYAFLKQEAARAQALTA